jgi:hypothetical protein
MIISWPRYEIELGGYDNSWVHSRRSHEVMIAGEGPKKGILVKSAVPYAIMMPQGVPDKL